METSNFMYARTFNKEGECLDRGIYSYRFKKGQLSQVLEFYREPLDKVMDLRKSDINNGFNNQQECNMNSQSARGCC